MICALISPGFSSITRQGSSPSSIIRWRASFTHFGHKLSVVRGQPSVGLVFCHDLSSGFSDHFGMNEGLGLYLLKNWMVSKAPVAIFVKPFSTYLIGLCISSAT